MTDTSPRRGAPPFQGAAAGLPPLCDRGPVGFGVLDRDGRFLRVNRRLAEINGLPPEAHLGRTIREVTPSLAEAGEALLHRVVETGEPVLGAEIQGETPACPGERRAWVEDWSPVRDAAGRVVAVNVVAREVVGERATARALRDSEARLAAVLEVLPVGVALLDAAGRLLVANAEMRRFAPGRLPSLDPERRGRWIGHHPDGREIAPEDVPGRRALRGEAVLPGQDFLCRLDDGTEAWVRVAAVPLRDGAAVTGAVVVATDITAARAAAQRQELLLQELTHRARNVLAVVTAALRLTARDDVDSFARAVEGRVEALARAHALLVAGRWEGAALRPLIEAELAAFGPARAAAGAAGPPVTLEGPPLQLNSAGTQALAMAVHELATNSVKHGALGRAGGTVAISWRVDAAAGLLRLRWAETRGPTIAGPPRRTGLGSRVIRATVCGQLGGTVAQDWRREGLVCDLAAPLDRLGLRPAA